MRWVIDDTGTTLLGQSVEMILAVKGDPEDELLGGS
jgi:hypothetical protein